MLKGGRAEAVCGVGLPKTFRGRFHAPLRLDAGFVGIVNDIVVLEGPPHMSRPTNKGGRLVLVTGGRLVIVVLRRRINMCGIIIALGCGIGVGPFYICRSVDPINEIVLGRRVECRSEVPKREMQ